MNIMAISPLVWSESPHCVHNGIAVVPFDNSRWNFLSMSDQVFVGLTNSRVFTHGIFQIVFQDVVLIVIHFIYYSRQLYLD